MIFSPLFSVICFEQRIGVKFEQSGELRVDETNSFTLLFFTKLIIHQQDYFKINKARLFKKHHSNQIIPFLYETNFGG